MRLEKQFCMHCGVLLFDAMTAAGKDDVAPQPGDLSICSSCFQPSIFDTDLRQRRLTRAEFEQLAPEYRATLLKAAAGVFVFKQTHAEEIAAAEARSQPKEGNA
jgi:hypothetical protein